MILFKLSEDLRNYREKCRKKNLKIGFVPTMGALHEGHISLISQCRNENDVTICSIFVNPTQFNNQKDFEKYPSTIADDVLALQSAGCNVLFLPSVDEMYPNGTHALKHYDLGYLETILEGEFRPGHYQGVCNIVDQLLMRVQPDNLYLGQKDFQQCMVIAKLIENETTYGKPALRIGKTLRETDGLAMSSRNLRLNEQQRKLAPAIFRELSTIAERVGNSKIEALKQNARLNLEQLGFVVDYIELANASDLKPVENWDGISKIVVLAAAYLDDIRLIDNVLIEK